MITPDPLIRTLTSLVAELACFIDTTVDEDGEPRAAAKQLDVIAGTFNRLDPEQRGSSPPSSRQMAAAEPSPACREFLHPFPEDFGLTDGEEW